MISPLKRLLWCVVGLLVLSLFGRPSARAQNDAAANLRAQAQVCVDALMAKDYPKMVDQFYPKLVEFFGGREAMINYWQTQMPALETEGITFKRISLAQPEAPVVAGDTEYAIVPQTVILDIKGDEWEQRSYLLGISQDKGRTWTFVDGAGINQNMREAVLPDLPVTLQLPFKGPPVRRTNK